MEHDTGAGNRLIVTFAELFAVLAQSDKQESAAANTICREFSRFTDALVPAGLASLFARDLLTINGESVDVDPRLAVAGIVLGSPRTSAEVVVEWAEAATLKLAWESELASVVLGPRAFGTFELQLLPPVPSVADILGALADLLTSDAEARALRARFGDDDASLLDVSRADVEGWTVTAAGASLTIASPELAAAVERAASSLLGITTE